MLAVTIIGCDKSKASWLISASAPILWAQFDTVPVQLRAGDVSYALRCFVSGLMWWLAGFPISFLGLMTATKRLVVFLQHVCSKRFWSLLAVVSSSRRLRTLHHFGVMLNDFETSQLLSVTIARSATAEVGASFAIAGGQEHDWIFWSTLLARAWSLQSCAWFLPVTNLWSFSSRMKSLARCSSSSSCWL